MFIIPAAIADPICNVSTRLDPWGHALAVARICCSKAPSRCNWQWTATISHQYFFVIDRPKDVWKFLEVKFWGLYRFPFADLL